MSSWFAGSGGLAAWRAARYRTAAWSARTGAGGETALAIPGLLAVGVFTALAVSEGGVRAVSWYPATLVLLLLLGAVALGRGPKPHALGRPALLALALLGAFVAWSFASIAWADAKGVAWDSAGRSLLYFCAFAVFAMWPWRARAAAGVLASSALPWRWSAWWWSPRPQGLPTPRPRSSRRASPTPWATPTAPPPSFWERCGHCYFWPRGQGSRGRCAA